MEHWGGGGGGGGMKRQSRAPLARVRGVRGGKPAGAGRLTSAECGEDVDERRVRRQDRVEGDLALRVGAEVDRPRGRDAHEVRAEPFEQGAGALVLDDVSYALVDSWGRVGVRRASWRSGHAEVRQGHQGMPATNFIICTALAVFLFFFISSFECSNFWEYVLKGVFLKSANFTMLQAFDICPLFNAIFGNLFNKNYKFILPGVLTAY